MIRIDEIYENTFLPWVRKNIPSAAIFYCDPFGRSDPDSILCRGLPNGGEQTNIFFFDQEPVQLSIHVPTFDRFVMSTMSESNRKRFLVCSETNSDNVDYICKRFNLQPFYYFFHGWAALDWFRGYDRTFLIEPVHQRQIKKTVFSPNRIIGGERKHRVLMLYFMARNQLMSTNNISFPIVCPVEKQSIQEIARYFKNVFPDCESGIETVMSKLIEPQLFAGEDEPRMSSCWLDQFELVTESLIYHVSETVYFGRRQHLTEKIFKPIAMGMPFVLSAPAHSLKYLRSYGFKTFGNVWNEYYDDIEDDIGRAVKLSNVVTQINKLPLHERQAIFEKCIPIIEHNWNWFYNGGFEKVLWQELSAMLDQLRTATGNDLSSN